MAKPPGGAKYIGDSVYTWWDGYQVWVCTWNGTEIENKVALSFPVMEELILYAIRNYGTVVLPTRGP